jgi:hypothetical protein
MTGPNADEIVIEAPNPVEGKVVSVPSHKEISEKLDISIEQAEKKEDEGNGLPAYTAEEDNASKESDSEGVIIVTGTDAATHLLSLRDDFDPALTFRSLFLSTCLSAFQAIMYQIYQVCYHHSSQDLETSLIWLTQPRP